MEIVRSVDTRENAPSAAHELLDLQHRAERMTRLHEAQEAHHHKQIWTKDMHGGPYTKVVCKAHDVVTEGLQRAMVLGRSSAVPRPEDLLGYERIAAEATVGSS